MTLTPRDYQLEARDAVLEQWNTGHRSTLIVMATGTGKTMVAGMLLPYLPTNGRALVLTPRVNIMRQFAKHCAPHCKVLHEHGQFRAAFRAGNFSMDGTVVLSTYPTMYSRAIKRQRPWLDPKNYDFLILDEIHRARAKSWEQGVQHFLEGNPDIRCLGMTATPQRGDKRSVANLCPTLAYEYPAQRYRRCDKSAIDDGWLAPLDGEIVRSAELKLNDLKGWDFSDQKVDVRMHNPETLLKIAEIACSKCEDKKTIIFVPGINTAKAVCELINGNLVEVEGVTTKVASAKPGSACCITSKTPKAMRMAYEDAFRAYQQGDPSSGYQFLVSVNIFTEGADFPDVQIGVNANPTKQPQVYTQRVGRLLRPWPVDGQTVVDGLESPEERRAAIAGSPKPVAYLIDLTGNAGQNRLCTTIDFMRPDLAEDIRDRAVKLMEDRPDFKAREAIEAATEQVKIERAEARERAAARAAEVRVQSVALSQFRGQGVVEYRSHNSQRAPSLAMCQFLERRKVPNPEELTFKSAKAMIDQIKDREACQPPTPGHLWALHKQGLGSQNLDILTLADAKRILGMIYGSKVAPIVAYRAVTKDKEPVEQGVPF